MIFWIPVRSLFFALLLPAAGVLAATVSPGGVAAPGNTRPGTIAALFNAPRTPADEAAPELAGLSPADEEKDVKPSEKLVMTFSEEVIAGKGDITITVDGTVTTLAADSKDVKINKDKVTINLPGNFPEGAQVSVLVPGGAFADPTGNAFAGIAAGAWNFSVARKDAPADNVAPTVIDFSPKDGDTEVPENAKLVLTFSEEVRVGTGQVSIAVNGNTQTLAVGSNAVKVNKEKVTIEVAGGFPAGAQVSVQVSPGGFEDPTGNAFTGLAAGDWDFTVKAAPEPADNTAPVVMGISPTPGTNEIIESTKLELTFSEEVRAGTGNITINVNGTAQMVGVRSSAVTINKDKVIIDPGANFPAGAAVSVVIPGGAFVDAAGNGFAGIAAGDWTFTISPPPADKAAPVVSALSPADGATEAAEDAALVITFDEEVVAGTGEITITVNGTPQLVGVRTAAVKVNKEKVTIDAANFPAGADVSVAVPQGAFEDKFGNPFTGFAATRWSFKVKAAPAPVDNTAPIVSNFLRKMMPRK
jgi:methionine-rich copper-binding protein CopC